MFEDIPHLRKGQAMYNFLSWLKIKHYAGQIYYTGVTSSPLADTFNLSDNKLEEYYDEWLHEEETKELERKLKQLAVDGARSKESMVSTVINGKQYTIYKGDVVQSAPGNSN